MEADAVADGNLTIGDDEFPAGKPQIRAPQPGPLDNFLSLLFPLRCVHCGRGGDWLCPECLAALEPIGPDRCRRCGRPARIDLSGRGLPGSSGLPGLREAPVPHALSGAGDPLASRDPAGCPECRGRRLPFSSAGAAFRYSGPARSLVHALKYSGQRRLARFMAAISADLSGLTRGTREVTLTYVPLHRSKLLARGYNHAGLYAQAVSRCLDLPLENLLTKCRPTPAQNRLNFHERRKNLSESISLRRRDQKAARRVILIDDVYTTGSTAAECAGVLREEMGVTVEVWTFARTVKEKE